MSIEKKITSWTILTLILGIIVAYLAISNLGDNQKTKAAVWCILTTSIMLIGFKIIYLKDELVERKIEILDLRFQATILKTPDFRGTDLVDFESTIRNLKWQENKKLGRKELDKINNYWTSWTAGKPNLAAGNPTPEDYNRILSPTMLSQFNNFRNDDFNPPTARAICSYIQTINSRLNTDYKIMDLDKIIKVIEERVNKDKRVAN